MDEIKHLFKQLVSYYKRCSKSKGIITINCHLFSTENGTFFPNPPGSGSNEPEPLPNVHLWMPCPNVALLAALQKVQRNQQATHTTQSTPCFTLPAIPFMEWWWN
jgi:hypothetical protein